MKIHFYNTTRPGGWNIEQQSSVFKIYTPSRSWISIGRLGNATFSVDIIFPFPCHHKKDWWIGWKGINVV